jgi:hypothetical protein
VKPDIPAWPVFPDPASVTLDDATETVSMPLSYWQKVAEYKISVDAIQTYITELEKKTAAPQDGKDKPK